MTFMLMYTHKTVTVLQKVVKNNDIGQFFPGKNVFHTIMDFEKNIWESWMK